MRKLVSVLFLPAVLFCLILFIPTTVSAEGENTSQTWSIQDGVLTIAGEGYMDNYSFGQAPWYPNRASITGIVVEEGLTSIGTYAFADCRQVTSVSIPQSVTEIGKGAFRLCAKLASVGFSGTRVHRKQMYIDTGNTCLENAEWNCRTEGVAIDTGFCGDTAVWTYYDDGKLVISGSGAMYDDCNFLVQFPGNISPIIEAVIESGITRIGNSAFHGCGSLESVTIEEGVEVVGSRAFENCAVLTSVTMPESVTQIGDNAFAWSEKLTDADIPASVTDIGYAAFSGCTSLTQVTIPEGVVSIGSGAFNGCSGLTEINYLAADAEIEAGSIFTDCGTEGDGIQFTIGDQVGSIPANFLMDVSALSSITIGNSVTSIGSGAFYGCSRLTEVIIPDCVTEIGRDAFNNCSALTEVVIPSGVPCIEEYTFFSCMALTDVTIPSSVTYIGEDAFFNCVGLQDVWYDGTVEEWDDVEIYEDDDGYDGNHWLTDSLTHCSDGDVFVESGSCGDDLTWTLSGNGRLTISGTGAMYEFEEDEIPWKDCYITNVLIEEGVTSICAKAFYRCWSLETAVIPGSVEQIGDYAFEDSTLRSVTIGEGVERIGKNAFHLCFDLTEISIPGSVVDIGEFAFFNCNYLKEVVLSSGTKSIGNSAFETCISLEKINIPDTVTSIGDYAFSSCEKLQSLTIPNSVTYIGKGAFHSAGLTTVKIPDGIETIEDLTFYSCEDLKEVIIPSNVKTVKSGAFSFCSSITKVVLPDGVTSIGESAFANCWEMTEIVIPDSVTSIGQGAFYNCSKLTELTIPGSITTISESAFNSCWLLSTVKIGEGVKTIETHAFDECDSLRTLILPLSLTKIEDNAFSKSQYLADIYYYGTVLKWHDISIAEGNEYLAKADLRCLDGIIEYPGNTVYCSGTWESRISWSLIGDLLSFSGIGPINMHPQCPWSSNRYRVYSAKVGEGITKIGYETFKNCFNLKYIMLPHSLTEVEYGAFTGCSKLSTVYYFGTIAEWNYILVDEENDCLTGAVIRCKDGVINDNGNAVYYSGTCGDGLTWKLTEGWLLTISGTGDMYDFSYNDKAPWSGFSDLTAVEIEEGVTSIGDNAFLGIAHTVKIPSSVTHIGKYGLARDGYVHSNITIIGNTPISIEEYAFYEAKLRHFPNISGDIPDYAFAGCEMTDVIIPSGVTCIGTGAFSGSNMNSITIPDSVTVIGDYAFSNSSGLKNITIPDSVTSIGERAFYENADIQSVNVPGGVTEIEEQTFAGCTQLCSVEIAEGVEVIGAAAFYNCSALTNIEIPDSAAVINYQAFENCSGMTCLELGEGVQEIGSSAFYGCTSLTNIIIPENVSYIRASAFAECSSLETVTIPSSVTDIEITAFYGCTGLKSVILMPGVEHIEDGAFAGCSSLTGVTIPSSVTRISHSAFTGTPWLEAQNGTVVLDGVLMIYRGDLEENAITEATIPDGITAIGELVFYNCTNLEWIEIPACVTEISAGAFAWCSNLAEVVYEGTWDAWNEISVDNNGELFNAAIVCADVTVIASGYADTNQTGEVSWYLTDEGVLIIHGTGEIHSWYMFEYYKESIITAEVREGITGFGQDVFYNCYKMTSITLPSSLISIDNEAFENVDSLTDVYYNGTRKEWNTINISPENEGLSNAVIHCTDGDIVDGLSVDASGEIGDNHVWIFTAEGLLIIRGTGAMPDFDENGDTGYNTPWKDLPVLSVEIQDGVTGIGIGSFSSLGSLTNVIIPDCVTEIGDHAFSNCSGLKSVKFMGDQPSFGTDCFYEDSCRGYYPYGNASWNELPELGPDNDVVWLPFSQGKLQGYGISRMPDQLVYEKNAEINLAGIQIHGVYTDGMEKDFTIEDIENVIYDFSVTGARTVTVFFEGTSLSFTVMVNDVWTETVDPSEYPESAHPYADGMDEVFVYRNPGTYKQVLVFSGETALAETADFLVITDFAGNEIGTYTGVQLAGRTVEVPGDTVNIRLVSDEEGSAYGFSLTGITAYHMDSACQVPHTWGGAVYTWNDTNSQVTASHACIYCGESDSETVWTDVHITVPAKCEEPGLKVYTAVFYDETFAEQSRTEEVPPIGHDYYASEWIWEGFASAEAHFVCRNDSSHTGSAEAEILTEYIAPECEADGLKTYSAIAYFDGNSYCDIKEEVLPATGHDYVLTEWTWDGHESAKASFVCQHDGTHVKVIDAVVTAETTAATCETPGAAVYTAKVVFEGYTYTDEIEEEIPALGHNYQPDHWTWTGFEAAEVTVICQNDSDHAAVVDAVISQETIPAGCEEDGKTVYTALAVYDGKEFTDVKEETIPSHGHEYHFSEWIWDGYESASAIFVCEHDATHVENITASIASETTVPSCEAAGKTVYTAEVVFEENTYTDSKEEELLPLGHDYQLIEWTWNGYESASAYFICQRDDSHTETVNAEIMSETTPASCEADGKTVYTASAVLNDMVYTDAKEETIPASGHVAAAAVIEGRTEATCTKAGGYDEVTYCSVCGMELSREHHTIPALGHDYELTGWTWASDYSSAKANFVCKNDPSHKKTINAAITSKNGSDGKPVYTATVSFNGQTYTDTNGESVFRNPFTDVPNDASYLSSLAWAVQNGIISGTSATTFSPNASCTRYQFAVMLYKLAGKPSVSGVTLPFTDVPSSKSYYKAVCWAYSNKIISGTSATTFSPEAEVTRYQVVAVLYKMVGKPAVSGTNPFTDVPSNASYYNAVMWAVQQGITKGTSATKFSPMATCQRYQMVVFLNKFNKIYHFK